MQVRRPLALFSLVFVLLVMGCVYGGTQPKDDFPAEGEQNTLTGVVTHKEYRVIYGQKIPVLYVSSVSDGNDRQVMCYMKGAAEEKEVPRIGETVRVSGKVSLFREASNPGEFNLREYYKILKVSYKLNQTEILERSESCFPLKEKLFRLKSVCCEALDGIYPAKEASILKAMLFGEKNGLEEEIKELYQLNGLIHILAISGLHVSLLGTAVSGLLKKCRMPLLLRAPAAVAIMWCYGVMTGMGVSTWRAVFMFSMHLTAGLFGRTYDMLTALSLAAFLMLMEQPLLVRHSGFLLSFGAVVGIGVTLPWWKETLGRLMGKRKDAVDSVENGENAGESEAKNAAAGRKRGAVSEKAGKLAKRLTVIVMDGFCLSAAIALTTLPVLFYFYYKYPVYSLILNLYVIPLMGVVFAVGITSTAAAFLSREAGILIGTADRAILWLYEISCEGALKLPGAVKIAGRPALWQIAVYYAVLSFLVYHRNFLFLFKECRKEKGKGARANNAGRRMSPMGGKREQSGLPALLQFVVVLGAVCLLSIRLPGGFSASFLDVGQGDCIVLLNDNGNCYMVDGGSTSKTKVGKYSMLPYLESRGIEELKAVILTHPDEDHISGVAELMEQSEYGVRIDSLILPDVSRERKDTELSELRSRAADHKIPVYYIGRGDILQDGKLKFTCLGPEKESVTDEVNEMSVVLYTEYEEFKMLLTGDVTGEAEKELLSELKGREKLTVLKVAHHGSKYSTPWELLEMTDPVYAIISAGKDNRYGHPHGELMERLKRQGCHIYQTSESGAVTMRVKGGRIRVEEFLGK